VGAVHVLTGHVNVNPGTGAFADAPEGTVIMFALANAGGATAVFAGASSCTTAGDTGSCAVAITSATPGTTSIRASTTVSVNAIELMRSTGDGAPGDSADATKLWADDIVRTDIVDANSNVVTRVEAGSVVRDRVQVARTADTPASLPDPSGTVVFHRFGTIDCVGASADQTVPLTPGNPSGALSDAFAPTASISYRADYGGDAEYPAHQGACEPLTVGPAPGPPPPPPSPGIAIVTEPKSQTVAKGGTATFTITVTNTGSVTLTNVRVTDALSPACTRTSAQIPALASMAPSAVVSYTCTQPNVQVNFDNLAVATGTPPTGRDVTASDTAPVKTTVLSPPAKEVPKIEIVKTPKSQTIRKHQPAKFSIVVKNTGNVTLRRIAVTDRPSRGCSRLLGSIVPGRSTRYRCVRRDVLATFQDVATVVGFSPRGTPVSDRARVTVSVKIPIVAP
jgi:uncharacterized repeat protein (TIGR01451 family)